MTSVRPRTRRWPVFFHRAGDRWQVTHLGRELTQLSSSPRGRRLARRLIQASQYICSVLALACLGYVALSYGGADLFQAYESWRFTRALEWRSTTARGRAPRAFASAAPDLPPVTSRPAAGSLLCRLEIPRLDLSVMVLEGDSAAVLRKGAGHVPGTALPGKPGNVVFAAHRDTFFRPLRRIRKGDEIVVTTAQGAHRYRVRSIRKVSPDDVQVLRPLRHPTLTLITCYPFGFIGDAPRRFVVQASQLP